MSISKRKLGKNALLLQCADKPNEFSRTWSTYTIRIFQLHVQLPPSDKKYVKAAHEYMIITRSAMFPTDSPLAVTSPMFSPLA
jgi:hypothetical protein